MIQLSALVLSTDPIAAALIASVAEAAGLTPRFLPAGERPREAIRRLRPATVIADCGQEPSAEAYVGPAMMFGARVALFCSARNATATALARQVAERYDVAFFALPDDLDALGAYCREVARSSRPETGS